MSIKTQKRNVQSMALISNKEYGNTNGNKAMALGQGQHMPSSTFSVFNSPWTFFTSAWSGGNADDGSNNNGGSGGSGGNGGDGGGDDGFNSEHN